MESDSKIHVRKFVNFNYSKDDKVFQIILLELFLMNFVFGIHSFYLNEDLCFTKFHFTCIMTDILMVIFLTHFAFLFCCNYFAIIETASSIHLVYFCSLYFIQLQPITKSFRAVVQKHFTNTYINVLNF